MRISFAIIGAVVALSAPVAAQQAASSNPCKDNTCSIVFDWGSGATAPDVDRIYGGPGDMEASFTTRLTEAGFRIVPSGAATTLTLRLNPQNRVLCDVMPGVNPDYSCHTVGRATVIFVANDSNSKTLPRVEIIPRCSDPKIYPTFRQFGTYAADVLIYTLVNEQKGARPQVRCR